MLLKGAGCEITPASVSSFADVTIPWQKNVVEAALSKGIISQHTNFRPNDSASR